MFYSVSGDSWPVQVGFSAFHNESRSYIFEEPVVFNNVISDVSNSYDPITSAFTCPISGVYSFTVSLIGQVNQRVRVWLNLESQRLCQVYITVSQGYNHGSNTIVTRCDAGERVWVESADEVYASLIEKGEASVFSGALLQYYELDGDN